MDCLNNTVQHRQRSLCIRLYSRDDYSSGDLPIDCLRRRMEVWDFYKTYKTMIANMHTKMQMQAVHTAPEEIEHIAQSQNICMLKVFCARNDSGALNTSTSILCIIFIKSNVIVYWMKLYSIQVPWLLVVHRTSLQISTASAENRSFSLCHL